ncbi:hypothetical protein BN903_82 [Halorubrum sp. AJ67]|nr:hypothetical protein BN903_82 [Halorubrum sp. AJ67]
MAGVGVFLKYRHRLLVTTAKLIKILVVRASPRIDSSDQRLCY